MATAEKKRKKVNAFLLLRLLGIVLVVFILSRTDMGAFWSYMKEVDATYFLLAVVFQLLLLLLKAVRWVLLNDYAWKKGVIAQRFGEFFESYAIGVITPGRLGELVKAGHAKTRPAILETAVKILVERGFDIGIFVGFAGLAMTIPIIEGMKVFWGWAVAAGGLLILVISMLIMLSPASLRLIERIFIAIRLLKPGVSLSYRARTASNVWLIGGLSILSNLSALLSAYFLALGTGVTLSFLWITGGVAFAGLLNMLPITVMGLGTREVTFLYLFSSFPRPQVLAFSGLVFLVAQVGGGVVSLVLGQLYLWKAKKKSK